VSVSAERASSTTNDEEVSIAVGFLKYSKWIAGSGQPAVLRCGQDLGERCRGLLGRTAQMEGHGVAEGGEAIGEGDMVRGLGEVVQLEP
jgi:hypothetical protein